MILCTLYFNPQFSCWFSFLVRNIQHLVLILKRIICFSIWYWDYISVTWFSDSKLMLKVSRMFHDEMVWYCVVQFRPNWKIGQRLIPSMPPSDYGFYRKLYIVLCYTPCPLERKNTYTWPDLLTIIHRSFVIQPQIPNCLKDSL